MLLSKLRRADRDNFFVFGRLGRKKNERRSNKVSHNIFLHRQQLASGDCGRALGGKMLLLPRVLQNHCPSSEDRHHLDRGGKSSRSLPTPLLKYTGSCDYHAQQIESCGLGCNPFLHRRPGKRGCRNDTKPALDLEASTYENDGNSRFR